MSNIQDASHEYQLSPRMHVENLYKEGKHTAAIRNLDKHEDNEPVKMSANKYSSGSLGERPIELFQFQR